MNELLTKDNFLLYCVKHYDFKQCIDKQEFADDLNRIRYIKKLLTRYKQTGELKERLILNHIVVLSNVFGPHHCSRILFFKFQNIFDLIKPFMIFLKILPETFYNINEFGKVYHSDDFGLDENIVEVLRKI